RRGLHPAGDPAPVSGRRRSNGSGGSGRAGRSGGPDRFRRIASAAFASATFAVLLSLSTTAAAPSVSQRGFIDGSVVVFPHEAPNDPTQVVADLLARDDVFFKPAEWVQFAAGIDVRANSDDQVEDNWRVDITDRGTLRPRLAVRRLSA